MSVFLLQQTVHKGHLHLNAKFTYQKTRLKPRSLGKKGEELIAYLKDIRTLEPLRGMYSNSRQQLLRQVNKQCFSLLTLQHMCAVIRMMTILTGNFLGIRENTLEIGEILVRCFKNQHQRSQYRIVFRMDRLTKSVKDHIWLLEYPVRCCAT